MPRANLDLDTLKALDEELERMIPRFGFAAGDLRQQAIDEWIGASYAKRFITQRRRQAEAQLGVAREVDPHEAAAAEARERVLASRAEPQSTLARGRPPAREVL